MHLTIMMIEYTTITYVHHGANKTNIIKIKAEIMPREKFI